MKTNITTIEQQTTMTSLEIAELTGKRHNNVMRDIKQMLKELYPEPAHPNSGDSHINHQNKEEINVLKTEHITYSYKDDQGRTQQLYKLDYELTMTLITGYSIKLRNAVIKRWQELEKETTEQEPKETPKVSPYQDLLNSSKDLLSLGFSTGVIQATMLEKDQEAYDKTGSWILPKAIRLSCTNPEAMVVYNRTLTDSTQQAALVPTADFDTHSVGSLLTYLDIPEVTTLDVNTELVNKGYQKRLSRGLYQKTDSSRDIATERMLVTGPNAGKFVITGWKLTKEVRDILDSLAPEL